MRIAFCTTGISDFLLKIEEYTVLLTGQIVENTGIEIGLFKLLAYYLDKYSFENGVNLRSWGGVGF